ncbi:sugar phosphate isomerase/epimerase family protein [Paraglaciecola arctica]|uniref:sugar phosphate isomerase/epimerase family protein n=1 Tax=Paraglaciecola arctica TaxID=1128911 RepID=UPI001C06D3E6|nr:sugar phosphate isomerase/epimerase family protein [Paraglaciecola arctica]MBU3005576.1 sugar phosphate isomerase/epimerase [Paraglaciecola arctica]
MITRRHFLKNAAIAPIALSSSHVFARAKDKPAIDTSVNKRISLSQWSFHQSILGDSKADYEKFKKVLHSRPDDVLLGSLDPRDIAKVTRQLGLESIDLVNVLFFGHAMDKPWLDDFKSRATDNSVQFQVLMCDETGSLGASSPKQRQASIDAHIPWLETAAYLGCKQLRVNAYGDGTYLQQLNQCAESLDKLATRAQALNIELLVENHGYASNNGAWLAMLMEQTNHKNLGLFSDLDNFFMGGWDHKPERRYDRVQGLMDLAPYTRGVSVKAHDFDNQGREITLDYKRFFKIFENAGFSGYYSAEFEGSRLTEQEGSEATIAYAKKALESTLI